MRINKINWVNTIFLITYQVCLLIGLPIYFLNYTPSLALILASILLLYLTGISITGGYHRLFSHKAYRAHPILESIVLFFGGMAGQGSALRWSFEHRLHHAHVDTENDPYNINQGFWYAHMLWLFKKQKPIDSRIVPDLLKNKRVVFQDKYYLGVIVVTNALAFLFVGWLLNDYMGAFVIALWTRLFALHHFTWFINSLAHTWGDKPFCTEQSAVDNYILAVLTFGEGYHNYHHTFANDYRNGIRWYHFDPTKWVIWAFSKIGLAYDLKMMDPTTIKKRMVIERKNLLLDKLKTICSTKKAEIETKIDEMSDRIIENIAKFNQLKKRYQEFKREQQEKDRLVQIKAELKTLKKDLRKDWRTWKELSKIILKGNFQQA